MRVMILGAAGLLMSSALVAAPMPELKSDEDKLSYIFGYQLGQRLVNDNVSINIDIYSQALRDGLSAAEFKLTQDEMKAVMAAFQSKSEERRTSLGSNNRVAGVDYLLENAKNEGVKVLDSGLQYQIIKLGEGEKPKATNTVKVHYKGTLIDGREFDNSYARNEPATFPVNRVIPGWTAILQMMPVGSHYKVFIPSDMAYGERGAPPMIGPHSVLVFDIELLAIEK